MHTVSLVLLVPMLSGILKITAGILLLYFGGRYAKKIREEHSRTE